PTLNWTVTLTGGTFKGRTVNEADGGNHVDTCHYDGSPFSSYAGIQGTASAAVNSDSKYADLIGMLDPAIQCYRANAPGCTTNKAPCQFETDQQMFINKPGSPNYPYITNRVKMGMGFDWAWSYRAGQQASKSY